MIRSYLQAMQNVIWTQLPSIQNKSPNVRRMNKTAFPFSILHCITNKTLLQNTARMKKGR